MPKQRKISKGYSHPSLQAFKAKYLGRGVLDTSDGRKI